MSTLMQDSKLEHSQTQSLLDVVFGVVIGLALAELPDKSWALLTEPQLITLDPVILLVASLVFAAFYWIETRFFIDAQTSFDKAIGKASAGRTDGVRLPIAGFVLGTLAMMAVAAGVLEAAAKGAFRPFLLANIVYWTLDLGGAVILKRAYREFESVVDASTALPLRERAWFLVHIRSNFFYVYSAANACFFAVALGVDFLADGDPWFRALTAVLILIVTLIRHLWIRSMLLDKWVDKVLKT